MSNFYCEICGAICADSDMGYVSGCDHYPPDVDEFQEQQDFAQDGEFENMSAEDVL